MNKEWFQLSESERIKNIYSKTSIEEFWDWWSDGENKFMEVRIRDFSIIKQLNNKYKIPYSPSGVYINNAKQLKFVISKVRDVATMWFGIQPRKKSYNNFGWKSFGGKDVNVSEIGFVFIDIDRMDKNGPANKKDLEHADILCNAILEKLKTNGWSKSYLKICSGNGLQVLLKLDVPLKMINVDFEKMVVGDKDYYKPIENDEYIKLKSVLREGVGKQILNFSKKFAREYEKQNNEKLNAIVDKNVFKLSVVGSLPVTKNYKFDSFTWRGVVDLKNGLNSGLSDYVLYVIEDMPKYVNSNVFTPSRALKNTNRFIKNKIRQHPVIQLILDNELPYGMINNYLWFQIKCLVRDSKVMNDDGFRDEFMKVHKQIEAKLNGNLSMNIPDKKFKFEENIINKFCMENLIPPIYPLWDGSKKKFDSKINEVEWEEVNFSSTKDKNYNGTDIYEDMKLFKEELIDGDYSNKLRYIGFIKGCIGKYGVKKTHYFFTYIFDRWFNWI